MFNAKTNSRDHLRIPAITVNYLVTGMLIKNTIPYHPPTCKIITKLPCKIVRTLTGLAKLSQTPAESILIPRGQAQLYLYANRHLAVLKASKMTNKRSKIE